MADHASSSLSTAHKPRYVIDKLTNTNYQVWKLRMELHLKQLQLWDIVSGDEPQPATPDGNKAPQGHHAEALKEWKMKDISAQTEIIGQCADRQVQMVRTLHTAHAIWHFFAQSYEHTDLIYQVSLIKRLVNSNMSEGQATAKFLDTWQALLDEVLISGLVIPETLQAMLLLAALPSSWRAFITTQATTTNLQLQSLVAKIQEEEALREQSSSSSKSMALITTMKGSGKPHHQHGKGGKHNHSHDRSGHSNGHNQGQPRHANNPNFKQLQCSYCNRFGHLEKDCRTKKRQQGNHSSPPLLTTTPYVPYPPSHQLHPNPYIPHGHRPSSKAQAHYTEVTSYEGDTHYAPLQLFATSLDNPHPLDSSVWLLDTGATHHMTYNYDWLHNIDYLEKPLEVYLGDNSIQLAEAYGDVLITLPNKKQITIKKVYYVPGLQKNLLSVSELTSIGLTIEFTKQGCILRATTPSGSTISLSCLKHGRLYPIGTSQPALALASTIKTPTQETTLLWHYRLGHASAHALKQLQHRQLALGLSSRPTPFP